MLPVGVELVLIHASRYLRQLEEQLSRGSNLGPNVSVLHTDVLNGYEVESDVDFSSPRPPVLPLDDQGKGRWRAVTHGRAAKTNSHLYVFFLL